MRKVEIYQGIPGSGKSTAVKRSVKETKEAFDAKVEVVSADHYFTDSDGNYKFEPSGIKAAHNACQTKYLRRLEQGYNHVLVDNTNIYLWELAYYVGVANVFKYDLHIVRVNCPVGVALKRGVHGVPEETVQRMAAQMEDPFPFWGTIREVDGQA